MLRQRYPRTPARAVAIHALFVLALLAERLPAALFTVGPGGTHSTIQSAIDAALAAGTGEHELRIAEGIYLENLRIREGGAVGSLLLRGGWNETFTLQRPAVEFTVVDAGGAGRALTLERRDQITLLVEYLTLRGGVVAGSAASGGNLDLVVSTGTVANLRHCRIADGRVDGGASAAGAAGGGIAARLFGKGRLDLTHVAIENNRAAAGSGGGPANGAGAYLVLHDSAELVMRSVDFLGQLGVTAPTGIEPSGVGLLLVAEDLSWARLEDLTLFDNAGERALGAGGVIVARDGSRVEARRIAAIGNRGAGSLQLILESHDDAAIVASDSIAARGEDEGLATFVEQSGVVRLVNWTVTGNSGVGVRLGRDPASAPAQVSLYNTIAWNNGVDLLLTSSVDTGTNLVGVDPRFVDPEGDDFNLAFGSPGVDTGDDAPPGGLGPLDFFHRPRLLGAHVDLGAYEAEPEPTSPSEPLCRLLDPSGLQTPFHLPVPRLSNVCRCLRDEGLNEARCALRLPEIDLVVRFPVQFEPGDPVPVRWTLHPWAKVGGPYAMSAAALLGEDWIDQEWLGPRASGLTRGKLVVEPFSVKPAAKGRTLLRTRLSFELTEDRWAKPVIELLLPSPTPRPE